MPGRKRHAQPLVDLWFVQHAQSDRIDVELIGQFVHRRLGRKQSGHSSGTPHGGRRADIAAGEAPLHSKIRHTIVVRRGLAAVFAIAIQHRPVVDIVVHERDELSFAGGAEPHALLSPGTMTD